MPIIGTSTNVTSLDQLQAAQSTGARLSLQKNEKGEDTIVATKGTLSDHFYNIWATCCSTQAHTHNIALVNAMKDTILTGYSEAEKSIFESHLLTSARDPTKEPSPLKEDNMIVPSKMIFVPKMTVAQVLKASTSAALFKESLETFKRNVLPNIRMMKYADPLVENFTPKEQSPEEKEKTFNRDLKNFLDSHNKVSLNQLTDYLTTYTTRYSKEVDKTDDQDDLSDIKKDDLHDINENLYANTNFVLTFSPLSKQISEIRRTRDYDKLFQLLSDLSNPNSSFKSADGKKELTTNGKHFFIKQLLNTFTVDGSKISKGKEQGNPKIYHFFWKVGDFLAKAQNATEITEQHHQDAAQLLSDAKKVLASDDRRRAQTTQYMKKVKTYVEDQRAQGKPIETIQESKISEPLLSPDARDLLQEAILRLTPPQEPTPDQLA